MSNFLLELRAIGGGLSTAIISSVVLYKLKGEVEISVITDKSFTFHEEQRANLIAKKYVPEPLSCKVEIQKLTPDAEMVKQKIISILSEKYKAVYAVMKPEDIAVTKTDKGFDFTLYFMQSIGSGEETVQGVLEALKKSYCGNFYGKAKVSSRSAEELEIEKENENIEYEIPIRSFNIASFSFLEGMDTPTSAIYLADLNFVAEKVVICGIIDYIEERTFKRKDGKEKSYFSILLNDSTASVRLTYFTRQKSIEKIKALKQGDSIVCTGKTELFNGQVRFTANFIDYGNLPLNFVPEKRQSKPVPKYYSTIKPQPFIDFTQTDFFTKNVIPECLKSLDFVVFDLETTGLISSPSGGNMDKIIEIGAYKIHNGVISESFTTFINPQKKLSEEIIKLTGITEEMVAFAPTYEKVMPDFVKFCDGCILVGHNIAGFDFKFVDHYSQVLGYNLERKLIDTIPLSQQLLYLANYKLNTIADHFGITFNHHRAIDDALVTAKIFIELIKIKKSLPKLV